MSGALGRDAELAIEKTSAPATMLGPTDAALVSAARAGERWAQEAIFRRYARVVNGVAGRLLGWDGDVDDVVQDTFVAAITSLDRLEKPDALGGWLSGIAVRIAHKRLRRRGLLRRLGITRGEPIDLDAVLGAHVPPDVAAELRAVYAVVDRLPSEERIVLVLRRVEGMELEAIAEALGRSLATVKRRLASADEVLAAWRAKGGSHD
jgi:RNA polymerase sigma-70 factor (ECF subfamily)